MSRLPHFPGLLVSIVAASTVLAASALSAEPAPEVFHKVLPASPGGRLTIEADRGSIEVAGGSENRIEVEVLRKVMRGNARKAAELLERHKVELTEDAEGFHLVADLEGEDRWSFRGPYLEVQIRVTVPREFRLKARTAGGSIQVQGLKGETAVQTAGGSLRLSEIAGRVSGRTSGGSITGNQLEGPVEFTTAGGGITLEGVAQGPVKVTTSGGSLRLTGIQGPVEARTAGGSIRVETSTTPLMASTSGGSIEAALSSKPSGSVELRSSGGGITLALPTASAFDLDAATSAGSVKSDFPVSVREAGHRSSLQGPVNGGGPLIKLRTSAGSIRIREQ